MDAERRRRIPIPRQTGGILGFLYHTIPGRCLLKLLTCRWVSGLVGCFMNSPLSKGMIAPFVRKNAIDMGQYIPERYRCYNAFFTRRIRPEARPLDRCPAHLIAPCDSKLSVYSITETGCFMIKGAPYSVQTMLQNRELARRFTGGICLVFRLSVDDYHRYCYFDSGTGEEPVFIRGNLHTVQPVALERYRFYHTNCREYTVLHTEHFGMAVQCEVGALMVGKICNIQERGRFVRGQEKGWFAFGGSTVVLLLQCGAAKIDQEIIENTKAGFETVVKLGEKIGEISRTDRGLQHEPGPQNTDCSGGL